MSIEQFTFPPNEDDRERPERMKDGMPSDSQESPEGKTEEISGAETVLGALLLGMKVKRLFDDKGVEMGKVFDEAKGDFKKQPGAFKEIIVNSIMSFGSLVTEHQLEEKKRTLEIRQKFLSTMQKIAAQEGQLDILEDYEKIQQETIKETLGSKREKVKVGQEESLKFKATVESASKNKKDEGKAQASSFIIGLMNLLR